MPTSVNEIVKLNVIGSLYNHRVQFGHHFRAKTTAGEYATLASSYNTGIMPLVLAATSADVNWLAITVASVLTTGPETVQLNLTPGTVGAIAGDSLPGQNSMLVSVHTGQKGRRRRGRFYLPGVSETNAAQGRVSGTQLTALTALAEGLQSQFTGSGNANWTLTVWSPVSPPLKPYVPPKIKTDSFFTDATDLVSDSLIVTQRRRRLGVGI